MRHALSLTTLFCLLALPARGQDLSETLSSVGDQYARAYTAPLLHALGANMNSGLFHDARVGGGPFGLNVYVGVRAFGAMVPEKDKTFDMTFASRVLVDYRYRDETLQLRVPATLTVEDAPTVFGESDEATAVVNVDFDTTITRHGQQIPVSIDSTFSSTTIGGLINTKIAPFVVPHATIGSVFGTSLTVRYLPQVDIDEYGAVELYGYGLRHSVSQYIPLFPIDLAVQVMWQRIRAEDADGAEVLDARTFATNVVAGKRLGPLSGYAGLQFERSNTDVAYTLELPATSIDPTPRSIPISFSERGRNTRRAVIGAGLDLGPLKLNADASFGQTIVYTAGVGIGI